MRLSDYIKELQKLEDRGHGDLEVQDEYGSSIGDPEISEGSPDEGEEDVIVLASRA